MNILLFTVVVKVFIVKLTQSSIQKCFTLFLKCFKKNFQLFSIIIGLFSVYLLSWVLLEINLVLSLMQGKHDPSYVLDHLSCNKNKRSTVFICKNLLDPIPPIPTDLMLTQKSVY